MEMCMLTQHRGVCFTMHICFLILNSKGMFHCKRTCSVIDDRGWHLSFFKMLFSQVTFNFQSIVTSCDFLSFFLTRQTARVLHTLLPRCVCCSRDSWRYTAAQKLLPVSSWTPQRHTGETFISLNKGLERRLLLAHLASLHELLCISCLIAAN